MTRIVLHLGQGKTGTTSLQQSLHRAAEMLRSRGILYPRFGGSAIAHHLLLPLCEDPNRLPPWTLNDLGGAEAAVERAWEAWNATCDAILADPPDLLVLSSELLIHGTDSAAKKRLAGLLAELSKDITAVVYVRHPVDHYRARLQEWLKAEDRPLPPTRLHLREAIESIEAAFPQPPMLVCYDRSTLLGGDIVSDFAKRILSPWGPPELTRQEANVGLSAEALVLLCRLRAAGDGSTAAARRVARLIAPLARLDQSDPPRRPLTLNPDVAEAALRAATCHRWLAETGRLVIPGLDVSRIDGAEVPERLLTAAPDTLFAHDPDRLERLRLSLRQSHPQLLG